MFDRRPPRAGPQEDLAHLTITDARVADTLSVLGASSDFEDVDFTVDRLDQLESGSRRWLELSGTWRDRRVRLEVHNDGSPEVFGNFDGRTLTLDELGLSEEDLAELDQDKTRQTSSTMTGSSGFIDPAARLAFSCSECAGPRILQLDSFRNRTQNDSSIFESLTVNLLRARSGCASKRSDITVFAAPDDTFCSALSSLLQCLCSIRPVTGI